MTEEERTAHQIKMRAVKTYDECKVLQADHRKLIEERAKEKGVTLPVARQLGCERMQARGHDAAAVLDLLTTGAPPRRTITTGLAG